MKPLRLKMQAFGPFVQEQIVDFEKLARSGMFLIKGPTGSGKTTIFDAMTFALYGGSSGDDHSHYYHPTTTPVPVIVIPPKTGDMTIWQSILHFLGIR